MPETFSSVEVCRLANVSYRQLNYWTLSGWLHVPQRGTGVPRRYSGDQVAKAIAIASLVRHGIDPGQANKMLGDTVDLRSFGAQLIEAADSLDRYVNRSRPDGRLSPATTG